jgi:hypothetical protein
MANERRWRPDWVALMALLLVSGCAVSKEARVRQSLAQAGVPEPVAACMAKPMAEDLTTRQLMALSDAASMARSPGQLTIEQALKALRAVGDPEVIGVLSAAAFSCIGKVG